MGQRAQDTATGSSTNQLRIVIVEDEPLAVEDLVAMIPWNEHGYEIAGVARTGPEAIELHARLRPDVLFVDVRLPGLSGIDVCAAVRLIDDRCALVVLSGYRDFDYARSALQYNAYRYLLKHELDADVLQRTLKELKAELQPKGPEEQLDGRPADGHGGSTRVRVIERLKEFVAASYGRNIGVPDMAQHVGCSPSSLSRVFRDEMGITPYRYLVDVRIANARRLLCSTFLPIARVSSIVGFSSSQQFSRAFHGRTGMTPSEYRLTNTDAKAQSDSRP